MSAATRRVALTLLLAATTAACPALAQAPDDATRHAARELASQAKAAFTRDEFLQAYDLFRRAYTLVPAPTIAVYEARSLVKLNRFVEAEEAYLRAARAGVAAGAPEQFRDAVRNAEEELLALRPRIPKVTIAPTGPGATSGDLLVTIDGKAVAPALVGVEYSIDPGEHEVRASATGAMGAAEATEVVVRFTIAEAERQRVEPVVPLPAQPASPIVAGPVAVAGASPHAEAPEAPPPPITASAASNAGTASAAPPPITASAASNAGTTQRALALGAAGVGVAGLVTGIVTGLLSTSRHADAERGCPGGACVEGTSGADALESFRALRTVSTIGYVVGGLGVGGGVALFLTAPQGGTRGAGPSPWILGTTAGVSGAF